MLIPLAIYLFRKTGHRRWLLAMVLLLIGALSTVSRTGVLMLVTLAIVFLWLKPKETKRCWPALLPLLLATHFVLPGTLGPLKNSFFPAGGLVAEQEASKGTRGSGRIADLGPSLREATHHPILGEGFGTRIVDFGRENAPILDDQWLGTLLETGLAGVVAVMWLFVRSVRRLARRAREDDSDDSWLAAALGAAISAYAVGMLTYDAFAFIQVTFVMFVMLGIVAALLAQPRPRQT
jgi:O-antigen ligase